MKPVITVYLLPPQHEDWMQRLHADIVAATMTCLPYIKSEEDMITLFPPDLMKKGLGEEIHIQISLPGATNNCSAGAFCFYLPDFIFETVMYLR